MPGEGFTRIIRTAPFRDLWETIQSGRPWSTVIKNRRKDGSYYWVVANVTPLSDADGPTGYMSVRTEASREQIEATLALMKEAVAGIQNVHTMIDGIDRAASDQLAGITQINGAIGSLDETTGANVAFAAKMAETTHELERLAEATTETVRVFRIDAAQQEVRDAVALRRAVKQRQAAIALSQA